MFGSPVADVMLLARKLIDTSSVTFAFRNAKVGNSLNELKVKINLIESRIYHLKGVRVDRTKHRIKQYG